MDACKETSSECINNIIVNEEYHMYDTLFEILMRVDPRDIFNCILVSKEWLSVITSPLFRTNYLNTWKDSSSIVVGLLLYRDCTPHCPGLQLVATSNLGGSIIARNSLLAGTGGARFFISKSLKGGLLLFSSTRVDPARFFVCKPIFGGPPVELPPPPTHSLTYRANILCDDDNGEHYKVVLAFGDFLVDEETDIVSKMVRIQIYCSWTGIWEQSTFTFEQDACWWITAKGGIVTKGGNAIYWELDHYKSPRYCFLAWDINRDCVAVIPNPPEPPVSTLFCGETRYGMSPRPQGSLLAATWCTGWCTKDIDDAWESESFNISILALDDDKRVWDLLYCVRPAAIWKNNLPLLTTVFGDNFKRSNFEFAAFVPGKSDSVFLPTRGRLFVYHFATGKLEHVDFLNFKYYDDSNFIDPINNYHHPLTLLDVGIWPSPPSSLQLPNCS